VVEIDGVKLGSGKPGPATRHIQKLYYTAIGADVSKAAPWVNE
jgi:D-alanine transaminase